MQQTREAEVLQSLLRVTWLEQFVGTRIADADHGHAEHVHEAFALVVAGPASVTRHIECRPVGSESVPYECRTGPVQSGELPDPHFNGLERLRHRGFIVAVREQFASS